MIEKDLLLDASHTAEFEEISDYINEPARSWWQAMNFFVQSTYQISPKITYSKCSMQKGWNIKYQKSGKSLCTLYPEKDLFIALIVIKLEMVDIIEAMSTIYEPAVMEIVKSARPFNGTKWLMIPVDSEAILRNVQELMVLKHEVNKKTKKNSRQ